MKRIFKIGLTTILLLFLFRAWVYKTLVTYNEKSERSEIMLKDSLLIDKIESKSNDKLLDIEEISNIAQEITTQELQFTATSVSSDPNEIYYSKKANCVGYSAMFNSIANHIIRKNNLQKEIEAKHKVATLEFLGTDIHQWLDSPFLKDHDYNEIVHKESNKKITIDPSVSDYFWIDRVATH